MAPKISISFAASALGDLEEIRAWYERQHAEDTGRRLVQDIIAAIERLGQFPESGRIVPEFGVTSLREIIHPPFRLVYRLDPLRVRVVRVWRSERLLKLF
jgi:toxin ParE1/3/4